MMNVLLIFDQTDSLKPLETGLSTHPDCQTSRAYSWQEAREIINDKDRSFDLIIVDKACSGVTGKDMLDNIVAKNPMVNTALVSELSDKEFHEATEGLGVLMRINPTPSQSDAMIVVEKLSKVLSLYPTMKES